MKNIFLGQAYTYNSKAQSQANICFHSAIKKGLNIFLSQNININLNILCNLKSLLMKTMLCVWGHGNTRKVIREVLIIINSFHCQTELCLTM